MRVSHASRSRLANFGAQTLCPTRHRVPRIANPSTAAGALRRPHRPHRLAAQPALGWDHHKAAAKRATSIISCAATTSGDASSSGAGSIKWKVAVAYVVTLAINYGSNMGVFFGNTNADIAHLHPTPLTPADWAFGIWGIIFLSQAAAAWHLSRRNAGHSGVRAAALEAVGPMWILGWACQSVWQLLFCYNTGPSLAASSLVLVFASYFFHRSMTKAQGWMAKDNALYGTGRLLLSCATAINAAWLNVATCVNICVAMTVLTGADVLLTSVVLAAFVALQGLRVATTSGSVTYVLTLAWSFVGVYFAQAAKYTAMKWTAAAGASTMLAMGAVLAYKQQSSEGSGASAQAA